MESRHTEVTTGRADYGPEPDTAGPVGLAAVEVIDCPTARALQRNGFLLPTDLRFASAAELRAVPGVSQDDVDRIDERLLG